MKRARKDHRVYLHDILAAIGRIEEYRQQGREAYLATGLLQDGIIRQLAVIGEAVTKLPPAWKTRRPDIPWKLITAMRNILIHDYSEINLERVWTVASEDLPALKEAVEAMLAEAAA